MRDPLFLRRGARFDDRLRAVAHRAEATGNPVNMLLDALHHVRQYCRTAGAVDHEQIRKTGGAQSEIGARTVLPFLLQRQAATAARIDAQQRPRHGVKPGCPYDRVERELASPGQQPGFGHTFDRSMAKVDERDVGSIESLEVAGLHAQSFGADGAARQQSSCNIRISNARPDLLAHKPRGGVVGFLVRQQIAEGAEEFEATELPELRVPGGTLDGCRRRCRAFVEREIVAGGAFASARAQIGVAVLDFAISGLVCRLVPGRHGVVRCALEHEQMRRLCGDQRNALNAG